MLRIAHVDTGPELRGGQQQLLMLARGLRQRGHEQLIVTLGETLLGLSARKQGFRVFCLPAHDPANANGIIQLRHLLGAERFQILHAHDGKGQTISWLASLGMKARRVASRRVTFAPPRRLDTRLKYGLACDAVIAISLFIRQLLMDSGIPGSKIEVIYDGVELSDQAFALDRRPASRQSLQLPDHAFLAGLLAGEAPEKGRDVALQAAKLLEGSAPQVRLVSPEATRAMAGASTNIGLPVPPQDLSQFFHALDLFIMPSRAEGLGSAALLAMAHGVPVVASRVGGLPEVVEDGVTGWLVPPGDPAALAAAIANAATDRERLARMGEKARERARQFSSDIMVRKTETLYEKLSGVGGHGGPCRNGDALIAGSRS